MSSGKRSLMEFWERILIEFWERILIEFRVEKPDSSVGKYKLSENGN